MYIFCAILEAFFLAIDILLVNVGSISEGSHLGLLLPRQQFCRKDCSCDVITADI